MRPKKFVFFLVSVLAVVFAVRSGAYTAEQPLSVVGGEPVVYLCDSGEHIVVRYFALSDESLRFVKVLLPDGREYTLPQVLSASGARYTDDMELLWWVKGDEAYVEMRNEEGEWRPLYKECRVLE